MKHESEDSLLDFVQELFEGHDDEIIEFYEQVEFSQLSENKLNQFAELFNASTVIEGSNSDFDNDWTALDKRQ